MVDEKDVRRSIALLTGDSISDEEMNEKYFSNPVQFDLEETIGKSDSFQMIAAFVGMIMETREK